MPGNEQQVSLSEVASGQDAIILHFRGGRADTNRLASLGFTPGVRVSMTQNFGHGPLIVTVRGTRVALGRGEAKKIMVSGNLNE